MDAFLTCPLRDFNGVQIVDWGSWSWFWDPTILPRSLGREMKRRFGAYPFEDHSRVGVTPVTDFEGFRGRLLAAVSKKTDVVKWLLSREAWDLLLVVFGEAHPAGHYFWHLHDPDYFMQASGGAGLRNSLRDVYVALDTAVGELTRAAGEDTTVLLVSGDGMGPNYSGSHLLDDVLVRLGALSTAGGAEAPRDAAGAGAGQVQMDFVSRVRNLIPQRVRMAVSDALLSREMRERLSLRWKTAGIAWPHSRAFVIENANEGYIRINVKGREPLGVVAPGAEYERVRDEIGHVLSTMVNPKTGTRAASAVHAIDSLYTGPRRDHLPDLVVIWDVDAKITTALRLEGHGVVQRDAASCQVAPFYTGNHAPAAFAIGVGPDVPKGAVHEGASVLDLAPTVLAHLGVEAPPHMTGLLLRGWPAERSRRDDAPDRPESRAVR
jgi:predicted AlkP superfamily phosphohydrolase/phosphomutase